MTAARTTAPRKRSRYLVMITTVVAVMLAGFVVAPEARSAPSSEVASTVGMSTALGSLKTANLANFKPGNIISDAAFFDKGTMGAAQIQTFLESKVTECRTGYTCLKDWYDTSRTTTADAMCGAYPGGMRERASAIIYKVSQACGINPQVLLVMLQKEQGLVKHTWPSEWRYTIAMGQGCPDTAGCDTRYYGFFNQVYGAAWQLKRYANPPGTSQYYTWYAPGKTWNVRYHPDVTCGSSPVFIQNQATANLYYYTPYQPNAAALAAGYAASTDPCAAYGNRNFYNYFTDWFASAPSVPLPTIAQGSYVAAIDKAGTLWGYPISTRGVWGTPVTLASGLSGYRAVLPVGDLDGDARRDVIGITAGGAAMLLRGTGPQTLGPALQIADWSRAVLASFAGDFDGDRNPDLFTTDASGALLLWRGTNSSFLASPVVVGVGWGAMTQLSGGVDMSGDGIPDLIGRLGDGSLRVYFANGLGGWKGYATIGSGWGSMTSIFSPGDVTGDGRADVMAGDATGTLYLYRGLGDGRISTVGVWGSGWSDMTALGAAGPPPSGVRPFAPGAGDVNNDGDPDAVALSSRGELLLYRGNGRGGWYPGLIVGTGWPAGSSLVTLGDFSGDGRPDLARVDKNGNLYLLRGTGAGDYAAPTQIGSGWESLPRMVGGTDFDGDRKRDVLAIDGAGNLLLYRGNGAGGWVGGSSVVGTGWGTMNAIITAGDFDGDTLPDILARADGGALWLYSSNGKGGWLSSRRVGSGWEGMTAMVVPGDFDGMGGNDLLARTAAGDLLLYRGDGRGGWSGSVTVGWGWGSFTDIG